MNLKQKLSDDAVSPVIGVMLMLVITVVIAAVITVFATGVLGDDSEITPMIMIDLGDITTSGSGYSSKLKSVEFIHKGGDEVPLDYIEFALVGSTQTITNYFPGTHGTVTISGESGSEVTAGAGDFIKVTITSSWYDATYRSGETVVWTMYDTRTNGVIASGDFVVP